MSGDPSSGRDPGILIPIARVLFTSVFVGQALILLLCQYDRLVYHVNVAIYFNLAAPLVAISSSLFLLNDPRYLEYSRLYRFVYRSEFTVCVLLASAAMTFLFIGLSPL